MWENIENTTHLMPGCSWYNVQVESSEMDKKCDSTIEITDNAGPIRAWEFRYTKFCRDRPQIVLQMAT